MDGSACDKVFKLVLLVVGNVAARVFISLILQEQGVQVVVIEMLAVDQQTFLSQGRYV